MQWQQRLNILTGIASDESDSNCVSAGIHLVTYRVAKEITGSHFSQECGLNVLSCDLLTKYENAHKISTRSYVPKICPLRVGGRLFKYSKNRNFKHCCNKERTKRGN